MTAPDAQKNATLLQVSRTGSLTVAVRLLDSRANIHKYNNLLRTPLHLACLHGHTELVKYLTLTKRACIQEEDANRMQPLHLAVKEGNREATRILLEARASPNQPDKDGFTALHYAATTGDDVITYLLMCHGGDVKMPNSNSINPIRLARRRSNFSVMRRLQGLVLGAPDETITQVSFFKLYPTCIC